MFVGHYGPALAVKALRNSPNLAVGFAAVQAVDIGFFTFALFGIERWRSDPTLHGLMPVDLFYMPYTHSLAGAVVWALTAATLTFLAAPRSSKGSWALIVGALVFSHWLLDLLVHRHDLGIIDDEPIKLGFGLWNYPVIAIPLELATLGIGTLIYVKHSVGKGPWGRRAPWIVTLALLILQSVNWFVPPPASTIGFSTLGLVAYAICIALGAFLDHTRELKVQPARK